MLFRSNAAVLDDADAAAHGIASALVVVARMVGMVVGLALLTAIGLRRFYERVAAMPDTLDPQALLDAGIVQVQSVFAGAAICAAVGALGAILAGLGGGWIDASAAIGALGATLLVFGLAHGDGSWTQTRLLLTGVIVAAGCGAAVALMLSLAPEGRVKGMLFWLMGDASSATRPWPALVLLVLGLVAVLPFARELNLLTRGEVTAQALGVRVGRLRGLVYGLGSLLTAVAVTTIGSVGFVGLIVPHLVRLAIGNDQRLLLPAATLAGGVLLTVADTAARTVVAPIQLPVGEIGRASCRERVSSPV